MVRVQSRPSLAQGLADAGYWVAEQGFMRLAVVEVAQVGPG